MFEPLAARFACELHSFHRFPSCNEFTEGDAPDVGEVQLFLVGHLHEGKFH